MLRLQELSEEERKMMEEPLVHARTTPVGKLKRAEIIWLSSQGKRTLEIVRELEVRKCMARTRLHLFNEQGLAGQEEAARSDRPMTYPPGS